LRDATEIAVVEVVAGSAQHRGTAWAQPNMKRSAQVLYGFRLKKMIEANRRQSSIRRMLALK
jgi:hypothetical protein